MLAASTAAPLTNPSVLTTTTIVLATTTGSGTRASRLPASTGQPSPAPSPP
jgi:hypothetical protein